MRLDPQEPMVAALVVRAQLGDLAALDRLLRAIQEPVYDHIAYVVRDRDAAMDVLQGVLLSVSRSIIQLSDPRLLRAWVFRIATRSAVRHVRRAASRREVVSLDEVLDLPDEDRDPLFDSELAASLPALIDGLPPACGVAVRLRYLEELSLIEVAEALDVPLGTVKSRVAYGVELLRSQLAAGRPARDVGRLG